MACFNCTCRRTVRGGGWRSTAKYWKKYHLYFSVHTDQVGNKPFLHFVLWWDCSGIFAQRSPTIRGVKLPLMIEFTHIQSALDFNYEILRKMRALIWNKKIKFPHRYLAASFLHTSWKVIYFSVAMVVVYLFWAMSPSQWNICSPKKIIISGLYSPHKTTIYSINLPVFPCQ